MAMISFSSVLVFIQGLMIFGFQDTYVYYSLGLKCPPNAYVLVSNHGTVGRLTLGVHKWKDSPFLFLLCTWSWNKYTSFAMCFSNELFVIVDLEYCDLIGQYIETSQIKPRGQRDGSVVNSFGCSGFNSQHLHGVTICNFSLRTLPVSAGTRHICA